MFRLHATAVVRFLFALVIGLALLAAPALAQQTLGAITGTIKDSSGASVPDSTVKALNLATNLQVTARTQVNGSFLLPNLPIGTYELSFSKAGFKTESHTQVVVQG